MKNLEHSNSDDLSSDKSRLSILGIILIIVLLAFTGIGQAFSQDLTSSKDWELNSINFSTGETPLSSGLNFDILLSKGKNTLCLSYNSILGQVVYEIPLKKWCSIQPTGGLYHNIPWAGPMLTFKMFNNHLITNHWFGWSAGIPSVGETSLSETIFLFSIQEVRYTSKQFDLYYFLQHYEKNSPIHLIGLKKNFILSKDQTLYGSSTYILPDKKFLWALGFVYSFNN